MTYSNGNETTPGNRVWNPHQGITFSSYPASAGTHRNPSGKEAQHSHSSHGDRQRAVSGSSLESLPVDSSVDDACAAVKSVPPQLPIRRVLSDTALNTTLPKLKHATKKSEESTPPNLREVPTKETSSGQATLSSGAGDFITSSPLSFLRSLSIIVAYVQHFVPLHLIRTLPRISPPGSILQSSFLPSFVRSNTPKSKYLNSRSYWTYRNTPLPHPKVHVCSSPETADVVAGLFLSEEVVGLDLEWQAFASRDSPVTSHVSLIQVASPTHIALFHIARFANVATNQLICPNLRLLIESSTILKTGVNIAGDCTRLRRHFGLEPRGIMELSHTYVLVKYSGSDSIEALRKINKHVVALSTQAQEHLGLPLYKDNDIRSSNWALELSEEQTLYAASDAYACLKLWEVLDRKRTEMENPPPRPAFQEEKLPLRLGNGLTIPEHLESLKFDAHVVAEAVQRDSAAASEEEALESESSSDEELDFQLHDESDSSHPATSDHEDSPTNTPILDWSDTMALEQAEAWALTAASSLKASASLYARRLSKRQLQAYHLYHTQSVSINRAARLLKIKPSSVACYVLEAIQAGELPCEKDRLEKEVVPKVPPRVLQGRFRVFSSKNR